MRAGPRRSWPLPRRPAYPFRRHSRTLAHARSSAVCQTPFVSDPGDSREVAEVEAWFHRRGLRLFVDQTRDEFSRVRWFVTVTDAEGQPILVTGRGSTQLEAMNDAQAFIL